MDITSISGAAQMMSSNRLQQSLSVSIMKQAADQQKQMADLLSQNAAQMPQPDSNFTFSTYA
jgi:hypothetical protein